MGFLDRLFGRDEQQAPAQQVPAQRQSVNASAGAPAGGQAPTEQRSEDEIAVERYRYLLRTAPPETIEQVHEEAFAKLTPEQRSLLFQQLSANAPAGEQPRGDDAHSLAQSATRAELRQPGTLERSLGGGNGGGNGMGGGRGGVGFGGMFASSLLGSVAGYVIGSALVSAFLPSPVDQQAGDAGSTDGDNGSGDNGSADNASGDTGSGDSGSGDSGAGSSDAGGWGGDAGTVSADGGGWDNGGGFGGDGGFGGGDFGGGDFGGGDFF